MHHYILPSDWLYKQECGAGLLPPENIRLHHRGWRDRRDKIQSFWPPPDYGVPLKSDRNGVNPPTLWQIPHLLFWKTHTERNAWFFQTNKILLNCSHVLKKFISLFQLVLLHLLKLSSINAYPVLILFQRLWSIFLLLL